MKKKGWNSVGNDSIVSNKIKVLYARGEKGSNVAFERSKIKFNSKIIENSKEIELKPIMPKER